jgi:hypothetical protein
MIFKSDLERLIVPVARDDAGFGKKRRRSRPRYQPGYTFPLSYEDFLDDGEEWIPPQFSVR